MSILIFILVLFTLVLVHEFGHFWTAKKLGMRVDEFGIGFPPKLFSIKKRETEYSINMLPIGGFVRIFGEDAKTAFSSSDASRAFVSRPKWAQAIVLLAGVTANVLFAWFLFSMVLVVGTPTAVTAEAATDKAELYIVDVVSGSPADVSGIPQGAQVIALTSGTEVVKPKTTDAFRAFVEESDGQVMVTYEYQGEKKEVELDATAGVLESSPEQVAIGVALGLVETQSMPLFAAIQEGFIMTITGLQDIFFGIASLLSDAISLNADLSNVAGPVGIVGLVDDASSFGFTTLLMFTAFISLNLAIINLLPFPALDGGRLLFVAIEAVKGSPIPQRFAYYANATGFLLLLIFMIVITYNDILRIL